MKTLPQSRIPILLWLLGLRLRIRVTGASMFPLLKEGDIVLYDPRAYRQTPPQIDDVVVALHPISRIEIVKRVRDVREDGRVDLRGDNAGPSEDSRHYGPVPPELILGRVTGRF